MANTTIQLRYSTETGNIPASLANGEIAINTYDGKLFYADPNGTVQEFSGFPGPSGLDTEIQFNDSGILGANSRLTFNKTTGTLTVNGSVVANVFSADGVNIYLHADQAYAHANAAFETANTNLGGNSFGQVVANGGTILATTSNDSIQIVGESGISVLSNVSAKKVVVSVPAGYTFTTADYGFVYDDTNVIYDYGTL